MEGLFTVEALIALLNLTMLEVILGIDNVIFINILSHNLPPEEQERARKIGLLGAMVTRILFLMGIKFIADASDPLFSAFNLDISPRDLVLMGGGLFLLAKATTEIFKFVETAETAQKHAKEVGKVGTMGKFLFQVGMVDIVFSIDSVITAVGLAEQLWIMIAAIVISIGIMLLFAEKINVFIHANPTLKLLALSFLIVLGVILIADGFHQHVPRGYIYFAMFFSLGVEMLNMRRMRKLKKVGGQLGK